MDKVAVNATCSLRLPCLLSLAALTVVFSGLSANAKPVVSSTHGTKAPLRSKNVSSPATKTQSNSVTLPVQVASSVPVQSSLAPIPGTASTSASALKAETHPTVAPVVAQSDGTTPGTMTPGTTTPTQTAPGTSTPTQTMPGTMTPGTITPTQTAPDTTTPGTTTPTQTAPNTTTPGTSTPAPNQIVPGRATRSGSSYVGLAGNIGVIGGTALGNTNFTIISKIGLTNNFSVRPAVVVGDNTTFLVPITLDFPFRPVQNTGFSIAPYVGAGGAFSTGGAGAARLLLTGGIDVPITPQFTATAGVNAAILDGTDLGVLIGVGYNFAGF